MSFAALGLGKPMADGRKLGARAEKLARKHLKQLGYRILDTNYTCPAGELDIVCLDGDTIVFVEVKARLSATDADPQDNIHAFKRRKLHQVAKYWLMTKNDPEHPCRFDAVSVVVPATGDPVMDHIIDAFVPSR